MDTQSQGRDQNYTFQGASPGVAVGRIYRFAPLDLPIPQRPHEGYEAEHQRLERARIRARMELSSLRSSLAERDSQSAAVFAKHTALLEDDSYLQAVDAALTHGLIAEQALHDVTGQLSVNADDSRAVDLRDVGHRWLRILLRLPDTAFAALDRPAIIVAAELTPSDAAALDLNLVQGLCLVHGSRASHAVIMARTLGIPAVVGLDPSLFDTLRSGQGIALNGSTGEVIVNPSTQQRRRFEADQHSERRHTTELVGAAQSDCISQDGQRISIWANVTDFDSAQLALDMGAEGVGLMRTEFLYLNDAEPPSEDAQFNAYVLLFRLFGSAPVIVRTMDLGGDKPPAFMEMPTQANPALGWRGIRVSLDHPELFKMQARAMLRAAAGYDARVMFPMIESTDTMQQARELFLEAQAELIQEGVNVAHGLQIGTMIETPAAALSIDLLAPYSDFFSIGSNDLNQYLLAVDRSTQNVAHYYRPLNTALLRLIDRVITDAHAQGRPVSLCGELAGYAPAIPLLMGLGLRHFSMTPNAIPRAKWIINSFSISEAEALAQRALQMTSADAIEDRLQGELHRRRLL